VHFNAPSRRAYRVRDTAGEEAEEPGGVDGSSEKAETAFRTGV